MTQKQNVAWQSHTAWQSQTACQSAHPAPLQPEPLMQPLLATPQSAAAHLPNIYLTYIGSFLDAKYLLAAATRVCQHWNQVISSEGLWQVRVQSMLREAGYQPEDFVAQTWKEKFQEYHSCDVLSVVPCFSTAFCPCCGPNMWFEFWVNGRRVTLCNDDTKEATSDPNDQESYVHYTRFTKYRAWRQQLRAFPGFKLSQGRVFGHLGFLVAAELAKDPVERSKSLKILRERDGKKKSKEEEVTLTNTHDILPPPLHRVKSELTGFKRDTSMAVLKLATEKYLSPRPTLDSFDSLSLKSPSSSSSSFSSSSSSPLSRAQPKWSQILEVGKFGRQDSQHYFGCVVDLLPDHVRWLPLNEEEAGEAKTTTTTAHPTTTTTTTTTSTTPNTKKHTVSTPYYFDIHQYTHAFSSALLHCREYLKEFGIYCSPTTTDFKIIPVLATLC